MPYLRDLIQPQPNRKKSYNQSDSNMNYFVKKKYYKAFYELMIAEGLSDRHIPKPNESFAFEHVVYNVLVNTVGGITLIDKWCTDKPDSFPFIGWKSRPTVHTNEHSARVDRAFNEIKLDCKSGIEKENYKKAVSAALSTVMTADVLANGTFSIPGKFVSCNNSNSAMVNDSFLSNEDLIRVRGRIKNMEEKLKQASDRVSKPFVHADQIGWLVKEEFKVFASRMLTYPKPNDDYFKSINKERTGEEYNFLCGSLVEHRLKEMALLDVWCTPVMKGKSNNGPMGLYYARWSTPSNPGNIYSGIIKFNGKSKYEYDLSIVINNGRFLYKKDSGKFTAIENAHMLVFRKSDPDDIRSILKTALESDEFCETVLSSIK